MVEPGLIEKLRETLKSIESVRGAVSLFALLKMDNLTDRWTLMVSAPWVEKEKHGENFAFIRELLIKKLGDDIEQIARIGIFDLTNHLSEMMLDRYRPDDKITESVKLNGNVVHEGYILQSRKGLTNAQQKLVDGQS